MLGVALRLLGLVPGAIARFKVYGMTMTGNENGRKAMKIVRPAT